MNIHFDVVRRILAVAFLVTSGTSPAATSVVTFRGDQFARVEYLSGDQQAEIAKTGILKGSGSAEYDFHVNETGWYALWVEAARWPTDLYIDGKLLIHTAFASGVWEPEGKLEKVINVHLSKGQHTLKVARVWFPGLPYLRRVELRRARSVVDMVRLTPERDCMVFRRGEMFNAVLTAQRRATDYSLSVVVRRANESAVAKTLMISVPSGNDVFQQIVQLPTNDDGVFVVSIVDAAKRHVDRNIEYVTIDPFNGTTNMGSAEYELISTISAPDQPPDYSSGGIRKTDSPMGAYLESGPMGEYQHKGNGDFFAYRLSVPSIQEPYLVEVEYPDDQQRTFTVSIVESAANPHPVDTGVTTGGVYSISNRMQTVTIVFYPREKDPRLLFYNWHSGQRAAIKAIRLYRVKSTGTPSISTTNGRSFGLYLEEPLRFPTYFGAMPTGNGWSNLTSSAERYAQWTKGIGANLWMQTVAAYQSRLWPTDTLIGYGREDDGGVGGGVIGASSLADPFEKDILRLLLLMGEKYGIDVIGELQIVPNHLLMKHLDTKFGGKGTINDDGPDKPWLTVSNEGVVGGSDPYLPYYNPLHPGVQDWIADIVQDLANRYKDSSAFRGVAIRLMGWSFGSWQAFPSIKWGYDDYTISLFEKDTGLTVPTGDDKDARFKMRYEWLMSNAREQWIEWRCKKIAAYHARLAAILTSARTDLKLYLNSFGPNYAPKERWPFSNEVESRRRKTGWYELIRETGVDPEAYRTRPEIVFSDALRYPAGIRVREGIASAEALSQFRDSMDPEPVRRAAKAVGNGSVTTVRFYNEYMEADFPLEALGLPPRAGNTLAIRLCAVVNPSGNHAVARYAAALTEGNVIMMSDGGLGYLLGQPQYSGKFIAEFTALPAISMSKSPSSTDSVALWSGESNGNTYFYLANRSERPVTVTLHLDKEVVISRLVTDDKVPINTDGRITVALDGYQLQSFMSSSVLKSGLEFQVISE